MAKTNRLKPLDISTVTDEQIKVLTDETLKSLRARLKSEADRRTPKPVRTPKYHQIDHGDFSGDVHVGDTVAVVGETKKGWLARKVGGSRTFLDAEGARGGPGASKYYEFTIDWPGVYEAGANRKFGDFRHPFKVVD